ncbi:MAG: hypothetical protein GX616_12140, partial [Planctomycetes bacterium]|nr:hypothetical protein [Planctomycetota bacterium]
MKSDRLLTGVILLGCCGPLAAQEQVIFEDNFESGIANWTLWTDSSWVPRPDCPGETNCWGPSDPYLRMDDGSHYYPVVGNPDAKGSVRHDKMQPWWCGRWHEEAVLADPTSLNKTIKAT